MIPELFDVLSTRRIVVKSYYMESLSCSRFDLGKYESISFLRFIGNASRSNHYLEPQLRSRDSVVHITSHL